MLEELLIFTRGGLILCSSCGALGRAALKGSPIDALIRCCLLEERSADASFSQDAYALKWAFHNQLGLVFAAVYRRVLHLLYVDDLLAAVHREFSQIYDPRRTSYDGFGDVLRQLHLEAEARADEMKRSKQDIASRTPPIVSHKTGPKVRGDFRGNVGGKRDGSGKNDSDDTFKGQNYGDPSRGAVVVKGKEDGTQHNEAFDVNRLLKLRNKTQTKTVVLTRKPRS